MCCGKLQDSNSNSSLKAPRRYRWPERAKGKGWLNVFWRMSQRGGVQRRMSSQGRRDFSGSLTVFSHGHSPGFKVGRQERWEAGRTKQNPRSKDLPALLRIQTFPLKAVGSPLQGFCWGTWPDSMCFRKTILTTTSKQVEKESEGRQRQGGRERSNGWSGIEVVGMQEKRQMWEVWSWWDSLIDCGEKGRKISGRTQRFQLGQRSGCWLYSLRDSTCEAGARHKAR